MRKIEVYSKKDIKEFVKKEVTKQNFKMERLINMLNNKVIKLQEEIQARKS